jgi:hypothetical protein
VNGLILSIQEIPLHRGDQDTASQRTRRPRNGRLQPNPPWGTRDAGPRLPGSASLQVPNALTVPRRLSLPLVVVRSSRPRRCRGFVRMLRRQNQSVNPRLSGGHSVRSHSILGSHQQRRMLAFSHGLAVHRYLLLHSKRLTESRFCARGNEPLLGSETRTRPWERECQEPDPKGWHA